MNKASDGAAFTNWGENLHLHDKKLKVEEGSLRYILFEYSLEILITGILTDTLLERSSSLKK